MSDATSAQLAAAGGFVPVECCGQLVRYVNPRPFTSEASARFDAIREGYVSPADPFGNGWAADLGAKALLADPGSYAAPEDGVRLPFTCELCGAAFVWAGGIPRRVPTEVA